jgi:hypothetical protein
MEEARTLPGAVRNELAAELSRRELIRRATTLGVGALVLGALPVVERMARPGAAYAQGLPADPDGTLQAFFDTVIPGRKVPGLTTELGHPIHPGAIAGVDREHGAVYTDALLLAHNPKIGFDALEAPFLTELESRALAQGGPFLSLDYQRRQGAQIVVATWRTRPAWFGRRPPRCPSRRSALRRTSRTRTGGRTQPTTGPRAIGSWAIRGSPRTGTTASPTAGA